MKMENEMFAAGGALNENLETIKFEKQVEEFAAFEAELNEQIDEIKEALMENCPAEMGA